MYNQKEVDIITKRSLCDVPAKQYLSICTKQSDRYSERQDRYAASRRKRP